MAAAGEVPAGLQPFSRMQLLTDNIEAYKQQVHILRRTAETKIAELDAAAAENAALRATVADLQRRAADADAKVAAAARGDVSALSAALDGARAAQAEAEAQLRAAQEALDRERAEGASRDATLSLLKEDRASLVAQVGELTQHEAGLAEESARLVEQLRAAREECARLREACDALSARATVRRDAAASTRTLAQIDADRDFHRRFPQLPGDDFLVEWFSCSSGAAPGYLYVSERHVCWEAAAIVRGIASSKVVVPIARIAAINKRTVSRLLPVQGMLFDIVVSDGNGGGGGGGDGDGKPLSLRGARWADILRNIVRAATLLGHQIRILSDGRDDPQLLSKE